MTHYLMHYLHMYLEKVFLDELKASSYVKIMCLHLLSCAMNMIERKLVEKDHPCVILFGNWAVWTTRNSHNHKERSM
jgi:hypothetical protein